MYDGVYRLAAKAENGIADWLYGPYDQTKYNQFAALYGIPGIRQYFDYLLDQRAAAEYMNRYQLRWNDVHDPRKLRSTGSTAALSGYAFNYVSSNVKRLYR